nr:uncharacterized protein c9e9.15 [Quercus suber]
MKSYYLPEKRYTFILKDELLPPSENGREQAVISWEVDFELPPQTEPGDAKDKFVFVPWKAFNPTYRGKPKKDAKPLDLKSIKRVSIMMRSFFGSQDGDFSLSITSIKALKKTPKSASDSSLNVIANDRKLEDGLCGTQNDPQTSVHMGVVTKFAGSGSKTQTKINRSSKALQDTLLYQRQCTFAPLHHVPKSGRSRPFIRSMCLSWLWSLSEFKKPKIPERPFHIQLANVVEACLVQVFLHRGCFVEPQAHSGHGPGSEAAELPHFLGVLSHDMRVLVRIRMSPKALRVKYETPSLQETGNGLSVESEACIEADFTKTKAKVAILLGASVMIAFKSDDPSGF